MRKYISKSKKDDHMVMKSSERRLIFTKNIWIQTVLVGAKTRRSHKRRGKENMNGGEK